jgi:rubrerythrin
MKMHRCRICGDTYLGVETPSHCPFCGAHAEYFVDTADYPEDVNDIELTAIERENLQASIDVERSNARFYFAMAARKDNKKLASAYKRLAKIEAEHCGLFCKLLKVDKPADLMQPSEDLGSWEANIADSHAREVRAKGLYTDFVASATSPRLQEVWTAVAAVENDHIELDELAPSYI